MQPTNSRRAKGKAARKARHPNLRQQQQLVSVAEASPSQQKQRWYKLPVKQGRQQQQQEDKEQELSSRLVGRRVLLQQLSV
jgi:hypothetical protein